MPNWKKIIVSGSDALLNKLTVSNGITGSLFGTASYALTSSYAPNLTISGSITSVNYIDFNTGSAVPAHQSGRIFWDNTDGALSVYNAEADITLQVGQESWIRVYNASGVLITDGTPVRLVGSHGDVPEIQLAQSVQISGSIDRGNQIIGLATHDIEINTIGYVTTEGIVRGLNTNVFSDGDRLFVSSSAGKITNIPPSAPYEVIPVGVVVKAGPGGSGIIYVSTQQPIDFSDLSSVFVSGSYHSGDLWVYNQPLKRWEHANQLTGSYAVTGSWSATSFTGSLLGTASYATQALSASFAPSTPAFPFTGSAIITGSLKVIGNTTITGSLSVSSSLIASGNRVYVGPATFGNTPTGSGMDIVGPNQSNNYQGTLEIFSNTTGADNGGSILLGGMQTGPTMYPLAKIVSGYVGSGYGGYLSFWTEAASSTLTEKMRITSTGLVGIGTTTPTAVLHLKAGAAAVSSAPIKLTAGTNLTTPEAGAIEFDGTNLFFTTGSTRQIAVAATSALTSSRIPYATTNGRLIDSANLTYGATANTLHVEGGSTNTLFELTRAGEITYKYNINSSNALNITTSTSDTEYYFLRGNKFGIGVSATARLHIVGGTATANTAPIKFTAGTNLTTPEAGTIEFNGNSLFFTTGSTRSTILTNINPASITGNLVVTGSLLLSGSSLVAGITPIPLAGTIQDGVTSVLGSLNDWNSNFYQGTVLYSETAASTITFGQLCYRTQNETWDLADATAANSAAAYNMLGICVKSSTATNPTSILINGFVETAAYATIVKSGEPLYMATTPGSMTKTAPTTSGNAVRLIGNTFWDSNTNTKIIIHFNPDRSWIELT